MASKFGLYNLALLTLGERRLAKLSEDREARHILDTIYDDLDVVRHCLEAGEWRFAVRTKQMYRSESVEPEYGYQYAFPIPDDYVRMVELNTDEYFSVGGRLEYSYSIENGYIFSEYDPLYMRYVSDDEAFGRDFGNWPPGFFNYVATSMAWWACEQIVQNDQQKQLTYEQVQQAYYHAIGHNNIQRPAVKMGRGAWNSARRNGYHSDENGGRHR